MMIDLLVNTGAKYDATIYDLYPYSVSLTKVNKLNYSIFLRSVYMFVRVLEDLLLRTNKLPSEEVFSVSGFFIDSLI